MDLEDNAIKGDISQYLESLPKSILDRLYQSPATCLAILRLLPDLSKQILYRLLYVPEPLPLIFLERWIDNAIVLEENINLMTKLHISQIQNSSIFINPNFQVNLHFALVGGGNHASFGRPSDTIDKHNPSLEALDAYSVESWENVLHFLVGTTSKNSSQPFVGLLEKSQLMVKEGRELRITSKGFQFLLQDMNFQVWTLLIQYLELAESLQMELVEVLNFLFQLGSLEFGQDYNVDSLTLTQKHVLSDLKYLGLVYQRNKKSTRFYPTRMATSLMSGNPTTDIRNFTTETLKGLIPSLSQTNLSSGFIMVETNYRVYAYTTSPLQIAILSLFIQMQTRFANMVVGMLTRESIRDALSRGITAEQIIAYLNTHSHPEMRKSSPILPTTVIEQIRLWEMERNRLRALKGTLYQGFNREQDYRDVFKYASDFGYVLWHSDEKRLLILSMDGHEHVRSWLKDKTRKT
ncbi:transcription factor Tfb2-domain-containing protein [Globomyces pollinis-pini]|nr:transcription factor Tfb2-domain-containing protein [Globomyces pollinis-pini]